MLDKLIALDTKLLLFINGWNSPIADKIMWFISGKEEWIPLYLIFIGVIIYKYRWKSVTIIVGLALLITLADSISTQIFKDGFQRLRPTHTTNLEGLLHFVNNKRGGTYGFVSSHAANSFALATFLSLLFRVKWFTWFIVFWAAIISYSRIYLGVHYPADVICGGFLGAGLGVFIYKVIGWAIQKRIYPYSKNK